MDLFYSFFAEVAFEIKLYFFMTVGVSVSLILLYSEFSVSVLRDKRRKVENIKQLGILSVVVSGQRSVKRQLEPWNQTTYIHTPAARVSWVLCFSVPWSSHL